MPLPLSGVAEWIKSSTDRRAPEQVKWLTGSELVAVVEALLERSGLGRHERVATAMSELEALALTHDELARASMAALYPTADELHGHDVGNAIGLWMEVPLGAALAKWIEELAELPHLAPYGKKFSDWLSLP